LAAASPGTHI